MIKLERLFTLKIITLILFILIIFFLTAYSIFDIKKYKKNSPTYQSKIFTEEQEKGNFYDRKGRPLTQNIDVCCVYYDTRKKVFAKHESLAKNQCPITPRMAVNLLAQTLDKDPEKLYNYIYNTKHKTKYICIAQNVDIKYYDKVRKLNYKGIDAEKKIMRYYPERTLASRVLGVTKKNGEPLEGLEYSQRKYTQGQAGLYKAQIDKKGRPMVNTKDYNIDGKTKHKIDGSNVFLTLDINIQFYAEKALNDMAALYKPEHAMCVVMDPKTSEVLACANYPKFDPNNHTKYEQGMSKNFAVQNMYEPGSTLKSITTSMALNEGYDINYSFGKCTNVCLVGRRSSFKCDHGPHGDCNCKNIIAKSCNIGAWYITKKIGKETFYDYLDKFGIIGKPGEEFGYEAKGRTTRTPDKWVPIDAANISFGQGVMTSCLAMCNAYCAIANGGIYHTPKLIKEVKNKDGKIVRGLVKDKGTRIISEETAKKMADCLVACVNEGTGKPAKIDGVQTAGKTGSAQMFVNGTYKSNAYLVSFMGFAPAYNPNLVIAVMVDRPKGSSYGAVVAAPVWQQVMAKSLKYRQIY